eukprot:306593-Pelagomonas_calceolata.AAC.1
MPASPWRGRGIFSFFVDLVGFSFRVMTRETLRRSSRSKPQGELLAFAAEKGWQAALAARGPRVRRNVLSKR